ncbi:Terpenoid synthase [Akanthomyces lecanii RCEF 1005]|uniref:Terpenoid synthase n=1 Tax=Akanthomyces lecanii RCEF 1005 TaxID=1081108 RepID=A0A168HH78_CORDF|nr:Terpenoid synthase [Akanthomyces lecanii RCEF 1005]
MMPGLAFVLGLKLSTDDAARLQCLDAVSTAAMTLSNDILSWPKETIERVSSNMDLCSSMVIFLRQPHCDERRALLQRRRKLMQFEMKAGLLADELLINSCVSHNVKKMARSYLLLISGFATWQCTCKRYSSKGPVADLVREVLEETLPLVALDDAFEKECEEILHGYFSIHQKYFK